MNSNGPNYQSALNDFNELRLQASMQEILALVKPQFEVGKGKVGKGGVVRDEAKRRAALEGVAELVERRMAAVAEIYNRIIHHQQWQQQRDTPEFHLESAEPGRDQTERQMMARLAADSPALHEVLRSAALDASSRRNLFRFLSAAFTSSERYAVVARAPFPWTSTALGVLLLLALIALAWGYVQNRRIHRTSAELAVTNRDLAEARLQLANETEAERRRIARDPHVEIEVRELAGTQRRYGEGVESGQIEILIRRVPDEYVPGDCCSKNIQICIRADRRYVLLWLSESTGSCFQWHSRRALRRS